MTDLRDRIVAAIHDSEDSCSRCKSCDRQHTAVMAVITPELERSAAAARNCARNTDAAAEMIRTALLEAHRHGPAAGIRVLTKMSANVDGLLDGLDLPAVDPSAPVQEIAERIASAIEAVDPVEWALAGQAAGHDAAAIARRVGADSA